MELHTLKDLYIDQLKNLYSAEKQLVQALPKMAEAATSMNLRQSFEAHLEQTSAHVVRLKQIIARLGTTPGRKNCEAMESLIREGEHAIALKGNDMVRDAALIGAAQRVEHYEIAAYGAVRTYANHLGFKDDRDLLQKTLDEEGETDTKLVDIAEGSFLSDGVNDRANRDESVMASSELERAE
jgi:ferritin-like metal-binding protein YciE